ncbi:MAG TPA: hypothetical protein VHL09_09560 [Dehalococcoidia bacterium]|nr:hypothetical protein [Dehalococcoidia bacterium]
MRRSAPAGLLVSTAAFFILLNLALAQAIVLAFYPDAGTRLGPAGVGALVLLAALTGLYAARGWWQYLRRPPDD